MLLGGNLAKAPARERAYGSEGKLPSSWKRYGKMRWIGFGRTYQESCEPEECVQS